MSTWYRTDADYSWNQNPWFMATEQASSSCGTQSDLYSQSICCAARMFRAIDGTAALSSAALSGYHSWQSTAQYQLHTPTSISSDAHDQSFPRSFHLQHQQTSTSLLILCSLNIYLQLQLRTPPSIPNYKLFWYILSGPVYKAQLDMAQSPRIHFDHSFILHHTFIYDYKLMIIG
jgi:hypothetical protein